MSHPHNPENTSSIRGTINGLYLAQSAFRVGDDELAYELIETCLTGLADYYEDQQ